MTRTLIARGRSDRREGEGETEGVQKIARGEEGREEERCWNLVEVAGGQIQAVAVSPATSMQTALDTQHPAPTITNAGVACIIIADTARDRL
jgi:hypothetical protein